MNVTLRTLAIACFMLIWLSQADLYGQWTFKSLHPASQSTSEGRGAGGATQVGNVHIATERACMWSSTVDSFVLLDPEDSFESMALGASDQHQVGWAHVNGRRRASLWSGTAASWVDLNPSFAFQSQALGVWGGNQVGWIYDGTAGRASLWSGSAASWIDLHPPVATYSAATAIAGATQVGWAVVDDRFHASLWSGTSESWVDLNPDGAFQSEANGAWGDYQVGFADIDGRRQASLWRGTAESWESLHPAALHRTELHAAYGPLQVGESAIANGDDHATVWWGTADSWTDLHELLPPGFRYSYAFGVSSDGDKYYVTGLGYNVPAGRFESLLWTMDVANEVLPESYDLTNGIHVSGDIADLVVSDDMHLSIRPFGAGAAEFEVMGVSPVAIPTTLEITLESSVSPVLSNVTQTIELYNYETGAWEVVDSRRASRIDDETIQVSATGELSRFVETGTGHVEARISYQSVNPRRRFIAQNDFFSWAISSN